MPGYDPLERQPELDRANLPTFSPPPPVRIEPGPGAPFTPPFESDFLPTGVPGRPLYAGAIEEIKKTSDSIIKAATSVKKSSTQTNEEASKASAIMSVAAETAPDASGRPNRTSGLSGSAASASQRADTKEPIDKSKYYQIGNHPHQYVLDLYPNGIMSEGGKEANPERSVRLPFVSSFEVEQPNAVTRTWTMEGRPYEEHSGFKQRMIRIRGRSGYTTAHLANFAKLRNLIEQYGRSASQTMNAFYRADSDKRTRLKFSAVWEGEFWDATIISFKYQRDASSTRTSYNYELVIATNGLFGTQWNADVTFNAKAGGADKDHTNSAHDCYYYALKSVIQAPPEYPREITSKVLKLAELVRSVPNPTIFDWQFWYRVLVLARETIASAEKAVKRQGFIGIGQQFALRELAMQAVRWALDLSIQAEYTLGALGKVIPIVPTIDGDIPANADVYPAPQPQPNRGQPAITIIVTQGQSSAFDVAATHLGNRNYWTVITDLNGMPDARTKSDGSPLSPGDQLVVPAVGGLRDIDPDTFYGRNLLFRDGDLVAVGDDTDIATVSGLANYYQNFRHRMLTVLGHNRTYPDFGLPPLIGSSETSDLAGQVYSNVLRQTLSDHRVAGINEMNMTTEAGNIDVKMSIITALQEKTKVGFSYPF